MDTENEIERVRRHTSPEQLKRIEKKLERNVKFYCTQNEPELTKRIEQLKHEWSIEQFLDTNASVMALTGALLGLTFSRKWLLLSAVVSGFLLQHAVRGWCPPVPVLRRLGVRTRSEIDRERFALKALRGDFKDIEASDRQSHEAASQQVLQATQA